MAAGLSDVAGGIIVFLPVLMLLCLLCCMCCPNRVVVQENVNAGRAPVRLAALHPHPLPAPSAVAKTRELGYFPFSPAAAVKGGECPICLEVLEEGAMCSEVPSCRHLFHRECIKLWMKSKNTCPLCRDLIVPGAEPLSAAQEMV